LAILFSYPSSNIALKTVQVIGRFFSAYLLEYRKDKHYT
jgi:hypothetical protein